MNLYGALQDWDENTVTWNSQPSVSTQVSAQAMVPISTNNWMVWDVTDDITAFINGSQSNYGWLLKDVTSWSGADIPIGYFYSKEQGYNIPYLEIGIDE